MELLGSPVRPIPVSFRLRNHKSPKTCSNALLLDLTFPKQSARNGDNCRYSELAGYLPLGQLMGLSISTVLTFS